MPTNFHFCTNHSKSSFPKTEAALSKEHNVIHEYNFHVEHVRHYTEYPICQHPPDLWTAPNRSAGPEVLLRGVRISSLKTYVFIEQCSVL